MPLYLQNHFLWAESYGILKIGKECKKWQRGSCKFQENCEYKHDPANKKKEVIDNTDLEIEEIVRENDANVHDSNSGLIAMEFNIEDLVKEFNCETENEKDNENFLTKQFKYQYGPKTANFRRKRRNGYNSSVFRA